MCNVPGLKTMRQPWERQSRIRFWELASWVCCGCSRPIVARLSKSQTEQSSGLPMIAARNAIPRLSGVGGRIAVVLLCQRARDDANDGRDVNVARRNLESIEIVSEFTARPELPAAARLACQSRRPTNPPAAPMRIPTPATARSMDGARPRSQAGATRRCRP